MRPSIQLSSRGFVFVALILLAVAPLSTGIAGAQPVWINEVLTNPNGSDSGASFGNEHFELRGAPGLSLAGYYLLSLEGQVAEGMGDINQFFDLGAFSIGANGYLFARQNFSAYTATVPGATVIQNTAGQGWGLAGASTVGYSGDGAQVDWENRVTTILLVNIGTGSPPALTLDLDANDDGWLDPLPPGWSLVDSVGILDGAATQSPDDRSYGAITLRVGGAASGTSQYANVLDVPGTPPTTSGAMYVGRKGESTGSTAADWFGAILNGGSGTPLDFTLASASDPFYQGLKLPDMVFGGPNPVYVPPPGQPALHSPASNELNVSTSPVLQVNVSDPENRDLTVTFYGGVVPAGPDFTIAVLPDSQYYCAPARRGLPAMFSAQADWIVSNRLAWDIAYVAHLGDIVDAGDSLSQWQNATNALYRLENPLTTGLPDGIPYGTTVGNHDQEPNGDPDGASTAYYNQFFGTGHFAGKSYYGGYYGGNNDNHFDLFTAGGMDFIAVYLEYDPSASAGPLTWANALLETYSDRRAIVVSHYIGRPVIPSDFGSQGAAIYDALKGNTNLFLMLCGHVNGEGSREDVFAGNTVRTLVSDYQFRGAGGNGFLRLLRFSPAFNSVRVFSYSPWVRQYETDADSQFEFSYPMQSAPVAVVPIATNAVPSGGTASCLWTGLTPGATYEWYVTVSNGSQITTGPAWRFATAPANLPWTNLAPILNDFAPHTMLANSSAAIPFAIDDAETNPTNLTVTAYSSNGTLLPPSGISVGGLGADRVLQLTPAPDQAGACLITVVVSDGDYAPSESFMLKVLRPEILALWDFNSDPPDGNADTGTLDPAAGSGVIATAGTPNATIGSISAQSYDPNVGDDSAWRLAPFPSAGSGNRTSGAEFRVSTVGCRNIALSWDHYNSATASRYWRVQYTLDGLNYSNTSFVYTNPAETLWFPTGLSLADIPGANDNPNFGIRLVSEWESTATSQGLNRYFGTQASGSYSTAGTLWLDMVTISGDVIPPLLALHRAGDLLLLSWPTNRWQFDLQSRTNLAVGDWELLAQPPIVTNGYNLVVTTNAPSPRFFRLAR
ncbi:MAG TPA: metallophosphoesterase [Candidatus Paceibacterota bacterium]|nr:metallophosphoesterase [Verrucomicrobiota bacterium]HSA12992.1 metallophosphoesterase [Candidatus Paceibacterota bacterium]